MAALLEIENLSVRFATPDGEVAAVSGIDLVVGAGERLGVVGESGSGKSQLVLALLGLLAKNGRAEGSVRFRGEELLNRPRAALNRIRGVEIAMIFQDPMTSLNPYLRVGRQMAEVLVEHRGLAPAAARARSVALLDQVGIPDAARRIDHYPHQFSGGMRQRVMIAMALLCEPALLIADEPTTALDVTVQAQILALLARLADERAMAILLITHDLGVIARLCRRVVVMYGGRIVEIAPAEALFAEPAHPYTAALLRSMPRLDAPPGGTLAAIAGQPPNLQALPPGCSFHPRCGHAFAPCPQERPALRQVAPGRASACHLVGRP
jgi:oligopeptide transport system ATP-binding protein